MVRIARAGGGLSGFVGSDSESDFGGLEKTTHRSSTTTTKRATSRPTSSHRGTKSLATSTRPKTHTGSRSPGRKALAEKKYSNTQSNYTKAPETWSDDEAELSGADEVDIGWESPPKLVRRQSPPPRSRHESIVREVAPSSQYKRSVPLYQTTELSDTDAAPPSRADSKSSETSALKRKFDELSQDYTSLENRYNELKDVGIKAAERNFDRLKKQMEDNETSSNKLISALQDQIKDQTRSTRDTSALKSQLDESEANVNNLVSKISNLTGSLNESQREIQSLKAKLAASRAAEATALAAAKATAAAPKPSTATNKNLTGQSELMHISQAKEELYSSLTSLIIRNVKEEDGENVFDCLQSGRNGTLHFTLSQEKEDPGSRYSETKYTFSPQIQDGRDAELMKVLPEYFLEDLTFTGPQISKFYIRLFTALTEKKQ